VADIGAESVITQTCSLPANFHGQHQGFFQIPTLNDGAGVTAGTADVWSKVGELITRPLLFKLRASKNHIGTKQCMCGTDSDRQVRVELFFWT
jgi:hypothetical protein